MDPEDRPKVKCSRCGIPSTNAVTDREGLCIGCRYLPEKEAERILLRAPADSISAPIRRELLEKEARRHRVGEVVEIGGQKLERVDGRGGAHQHWNIKVESLLLPGMGSRRRRGR